jgi:hypothetical protein
VEYEGMMNKLYSVKAQCVFNENLKPMRHIHPPEYRIIAKSHGIAAAKAIEVFESENDGLILVGPDNLDVELVAKESTKNAYPKLIICE